MNILVTGALGYLGPVIVRSLKAAGHRVTGLDVGWFLHSHAEAMDFPMDVLFYDIREPWATVLPAYDAVVHLAGLSNDPVGNLHPNLTVRINYKGTIDLMRAQPNARHVFVSSCSVYGANEMATETSLTDPLTPYAKSKAMVDEWLDANRINAISLRLGTAYGYSPGHRLDLSINNMVHDAVTGFPVKVNGNNPSRPFVHVEDIATAIGWALGNDSRGVVNVVGENCKMYDVASVIADFCGAPIIYEQSPDKRDYMADGSLLRAMGWSPRHTVESTLPVLAERTINLPPGAYNRLRTLTRLIDAGILTPQLTRKEAVVA